MNHIIALFCDVQKRRRFSIILVVPCCQLAAGLHQVYVIDGGELMEASTVSRGRLQLSDRIRVSKH